MRQLVLLLTVGASLFADVTVAIETTSGDIIRGKVTHRGVADASGMEFHPLPFDTQ